MPDVWQHFVFNLFRYTISYIFDSHHLRGPRLFPLCATKSHLTLHNIFQDEDKINHLPTAEKLFMQHSISFKVIPDF